MYDQKTMLDRVARDFAYHPPTDEAVVDHENIREAFTALALEVAECLPAGRDQSLCITHLEDAHARAHAAIAKDHPSKQEEPVEPNGMRRVQVDTSRMKPVPVANREGEASRFA